MTTRPLPDPTELKADQAAAPAPPVLPVGWRARVLLTPFGDSAPPMAKYDQLVVADVIYSNYNPRAPFIRIKLYLTEDLTYFDFVFAKEGWYWLVSKPGGPIENSYGPFATPLIVPAQDFVAAMGGRYGNTWPIMGRSCDGWVIPTPVSQGASDHGSWYSFTPSGQLARIFTFDATNPCKLPILGSYYLANVATFAPGEPDDDLLRFMGEIEDREEPEAVAFQNPMVTQEDIQRALAAPLASAPCTVGQIQALIPGFVPTPTGKLPVWTDKTLIQGWTIGTDFIPYQTLVYYWYSYGRQNSYFVGLGLEPGKGTYNDMQATCLYTNHAEPSKDYTDIPQYVLAKGMWEPQCCDGRLPGIGVPRPDWVTAANGKIMASITGNPAFGLKAGETLNLIECPFERASGEEAIFWVWFTGDERGVLFTEANFLNSTDHSLQLIDYQLFQRNASQISPQDFPDPCPKLPACPSSPVALARRDGLQRRIIGPSTASARAAS